MSKMHWQVFLRDFPGNAMEASELRVEYIWSALVASVETYAMFTMYVCKMPFLNDHRRESFVQTSI